MEKEYPLLREYAPPAEGEFRGGAESEFPGISSASQPEQSESEKQSSMRRLLRVYILSAALGITALLPKGFVPRPYDPIPESFAYGFESLSEGEARMENELWFEYFGQLGEYTGSYFGVFGETADGEGPTDSFRAALTVEESGRVYDSYLGLETYPFTLLLPEGVEPFGSREVHGLLYRLNSSRDVLLSYVYEGIGCIRLIPESAADESGTVSLALPYDDPPDELPFRVYGNGTDIVGVFERSPEHILFHVTPEHSNFAGREDVAYVFDIRNTAE